MEIVQILIGGNKSKEVASNAMAYVILEPHGEYVDEQNDQLCK